MGKTRTIDIQDGPDGETRQRELTSLEWSLQFVLLKIQEMASSYTLSGSNEP